MLIHGRLILTAHGFMLDEVRSLLQKALRRKEAKCVSQSAKELVSFGKDQLPWKSLMTFLFEDHCLSSCDTINAFVSAYLAKDKLKALETLFSTRTCRIAACLPVLALEERYAPFNWATDTPVDSDTQGLVVPQPGSINFCAVLNNMKDAWVKKDEDKLITCFKLASVCIDHEKRELTPKGRQLCQGVKSDCAGLLLVVLNTLKLNTDSTEMKRFIDSCMRVTSFPGAPLRLILFTVLAKLLFADKANLTPIENLGTLGWGNDEILSDMPAWAVDKHTYRGKFGRSSKHLLKAKRPDDMSEGGLEEFHGQRPKKTIEDFFEEAVLETRSAVECNPYWERAKAQYLNRPRHLQKTVKMTAVWVADMKSMYPAIVEPGSVPKQEVCGRAKRKRTKNNTSAAEECSPGGSKVKVKRAKLSASSAASTPVLKGPLLQLPTGAAKVHTCLEIKTDTVWKGPYTEARLNLLLFYHEAMKTVCGDLHTLDVSRHGNYVCFPFLKSATAEIVVTERDYYDAILKSRVTGLFVSREPLGIIQVHKLPLAKVNKLPASLWSHFLFRFALNIGDSGLYNALTDSDVSFLYGVDMEERRASVRGKDVLHLMFVKLPRAEVCKAISAQVRLQSHELARYLSKDFDLDLLKTLVEKFQVDFNIDLFKRRIAMCKAAVLKHS